MLKARRLTSGLPVTRPGEQIAIVSAHLRRDEWAYLLTLAGRRGFQGQGIGGRVGIHAEIPDVQIHLAR